MSRLLKILSAFRADRRGASAMEYGLLAALIAIAAMAGMTNFGEGLGNMWGEVDSAVNR